MAKGPNTDNIPKTASPLDQVLAAADPAPASAPPLPRVATVSALRTGFRRCGRAWGGTTAVRVCPDGVAPGPDEITEAQLAILQAERNLVVVVVG